MTRDWALRQGFVKTDDGLEIFYRVHGSGEPALVCCNGIGVGTFFWKFVVDGFAPERSVVVWDYRGHGRSGKPGPDHRLDIARCALDLGHVCDELELDRPLLLGHSMGSQVILERYRQAPARVGGLVSVLGTFGRPLDTFSDLKASRQIFDIVLQLSESAPAVMDRVCKFLVSTPLAYDLARVAKMVDGTRISRHDLRDYLLHLTQVGFPFFFRMLAELGEHSAEDLLPKVNVPVLVVAGEFDAFTPSWLARKMDEQLPDSELLWLEGASHAGIIEQPGAINDAVRDMLTRRVDPQR